MHDEYEKLNFGGTRWIKRLSFGGIRCTNWRPVNCHDAHEADS